MKLKTLPRMRVNSWLITPYEGQLFNEIARLPRMRPNQGILGESIAPYEYTFITITICHVFLITGNSE